MQWVSLILETLLHTWSRYVDDDDDDDDFTTRDDDEHDNDVDGGGGDRDDNDDDGGSVGGGDGDGDISIWSNWWTQCPPASLYNVVQC